MFCVLNFQQFLENVRRLFFSFLKPTTLWKGLIYVQLDIIQQQNDDSAVGSPDS